MTADHHEGPAARRRDRLATARLYVCVDLSRGLEGLLEFADSAFRGGVDILQVRDKHAEAGAELEALRALRQIADRHGALLAANDRADVAALAGVDVLHLGQGDLSTADARTVVGPDVLIGRSTRTVEQLHEADQDPGIDYFCTGPIWSTPTKPGRAAVGLELARAAAQRGEDAGSTGTSATRVVSTAPAGSPSSRSEVSTSAGCRRCCRPAPTASWWSGPSPRRPIPRRRRASCGRRSPRHRRDDHRGGAATVAR